jgi:serine/threonine-protein kinase
MGLDPQEARTRWARSETDDDSTGFLLADEKPPKFLKAYSRYEVLSEIGRGGEGIVYLARDRELKRNVAIKVLRLDLLDRSAAVERFQEEAKIICRLQHPGIAHIYDIGMTEDGRPCHAMKLVTGMDMQSKLQHRPGDPKLRAEAISDFARVCDTIAYTHSCGIVHLDLKPLNFMIGVFGEVHVMDWGTAKRLNSRGKYFHNVPPEKITADQPVMGGTLQYMCPEQASGGAITTQSDVFALGATLAHILTGQPAYVCMDRRQGVEMSRSADLNACLVRLKECDEDPALVRLAVHCMQIDPARRPPDAGAVAEYLSDYEQTALNRFESDMSRFFELSHDLFCFADLEGYLRRINSNFSKVLGYSESELLESPFMNYVHEDDHQKTIDAMKNLNEGRPVIRFCNRYRTKSGSYVDFEWTAKSIPEEGLIFAVARDVSN